MPRKEWVNICKCGAKYETPDSLTRHINIYNDPDTHARKRASNVLSADQKYSLFAVLEESGYVMPPVQQEIMFMRVENLVNAGKLDVNDFRHTLYLDGFRLQEEQKVALEQMVERLIEEHA